MKTINYTPSRYDSYKAYQAFRDKEEARRYQVMALSFCTSVLGMACIIAYQLILGGY